eukprot:4418831-Amphidinium_carterae.1
MQFHPPRVVNLSTAAYLIPISGAPVQVTQGALEICIAGTYAIVVRVRPEAALRGQLGLAPVTDWESEIRAVLRLADKADEDAVLEAWTPQSFTDGGALVKLRSTQLATLLRHAHRRGVLADTPREERGNYETLWLKQRACNIAEALECLRSFPEHAGLLMRKVKDRDEFAMRVSAAQLRAAQVAL